MFNISCQSPFSREEVEGLKENADTAILRHFPWAKEEFFKRGWSLPRTIDRVYVIEKAMKLLGYHPYHNFAKWFAKQGK